MKEAYIVFENEYVLPSDSWLAVIKVQGLIDWEEEAVPSAPVLNFRASTTISGND